jgi:alginate O-acetyltransferase complex protein AlgI
MLLSTAPFFVFFLIVWLLYWLLGRFQIARLLVLFFANLFFLMKFGALYFALPVAATVDFLVGIGLGRPAVEGEGKGRRRALLGVSLLLNVGLLASTKILSVAVGDRYSWLLTLSLSFYCFQSLTYTVDLYRREDGAEATRSWLGYLAGALFFPVMVAGPILRLHDFFTQLFRKPVLTPELAGRALLLIGIGLVKKLLIADFLAENLVTRVFDTPTLYSGLEVLTAIYGYALQLFFDFSGYTDIALGVGLLLGLRLPENFNRPYLAVNLMDFWRRWHISFSTWLRDYIQERLPQRRRTHPLASYCYTVIVTFLLGGLWHGIGWTFLTWGLLHGFALAAVRIWKQLRNQPRGKKPSRGGTVLATFLTFHFVCFTWIFFHASSMANACEVLGRLGSLTWGHDNLTLPILGVLGLATVLHCLPIKWLDGSGRLLGRMPFWVQGAALAGLVLLIQSLSGRGSATFIYGSF